ncbi:hypothetical protein C8K66_102261 [Pseudomonas sp. GV105]|nr:hypothetical protein C8K66_102261 [Pseudomonas sp. GV105]
MILASTASFWSSLVLSMTKVIISVIMTSFWLWRVNAEVVLFLKNNGRRPKGLFIARLQINRLLEYFNFIV